MKGLTLILIVIGFCSCKRENRGLFSQIDSDNNVTNFRRIEGSLDVTDSTKFNAFQFSKNDLFDIKGYWGQLNDTLYFINSVLVYEDTCYVKFPILIFNHEKEVIVDQSSNCEYSPVLAGGSSYLIEVISKSKDEDTFHIKHTLYTHSTAKSQTTSILTLSLKHGIINYVENKEFEKAIIPWTLGVKSDQKPAGNNG